MKWVNRRGGGLAVKERLEPTQARAFAADLRKRVLAAAGPGKAAPPRPAQRPAAPKAPAPKPEEPDYSDIPF